MVIFYLIRRIYENCKKKRVFITSSEHIIFKISTLFFDDISIKGDTLSSGNDFYYQDIADAVDCDSSADFADVLFKSQETGESFKLDFECESRDGFYDGEEVMFAVWERADIEALLKRLSFVLDAAKC